MDKKWLNYLARLCIELDLMLTIDFQDILNRFANHEVFNNVIVY